MFKINFAGCFLFLFMVLFTGTTNGQHDQMLIGYLEKKDFIQEPYNKWFNENYNSYEVEKQTISDINIKQDDISFLVFLGSWCGDTKRELPRFIKIMEHLKFPAEKITLIGLDRTKKAPVYAENTRNIEYVPTFIVLKNGFEIGRIIEQPLISLEADLRQIIGIKYQQAEGKVLLRNGEKADVIPVFGDCSKTENPAEQTACSEKQLSAFLEKNMIRMYEGKPLTGKAKVSFIVDVDGMVKDVRVPRSKSKAVKAEALRLLNKMNMQYPGWKPAILNEQPVASRNKILIDFDED